MWDRELICSLFRRREELTIYSILCFEQTLSFNRLLKHSFCLKKETEVVFDFTPEWSRLPVNLSFHLKTYFHCILGKCLGVL